MRLRHNAAFGDMQACWRQTDQVVVQIRQQTVQSVGSLIRFHIIQTNHPAKSALIPFKTVSDFAALEGWLEPNTLELTVRQWEAIGYFALSPCGRG